jgi:hypothetical protein
MGRLLPRCIAIAALALSAFGIAAVASPAGAGASTTHWLGSWSGDVSQTPEANPPAPQNPYVAQITIKSVTGKKVGMVTYPAWSCDYVLKFKSITSKKIEMTEVLKDQGPFNCTASETIVLRKTGKTSASFTGIFDGSDDESGSLTKG